MKKETFRNMYSKCVPDKAVTRRLLQIIVEDDMINFAKKRRAADDEDTEDYLHISVVPGKKKISPILPAAAAVVCIIGAAVYMANSGGDLSGEITSGSGDYGSTDVIPEMAAMDMPVGKGYASTAANGGNAVSVEIGDRANEKDGGQWVFATSIVGEGSVTPHNVDGGGVWETVLTERPPSGEVPPAEDSPVEAFTAAEEKEPTSTFRGFLTLYGRDDSGEGIKMTYYDSFIDSPDDRITVQYKDTDKIFSLLWEYADICESPMPVSGDLIPTVCLEIIYRDASKNPPEISSNRDGVVRVFVKSCGIAVELMTGEYFEFGCNSSALFDELHKIVREASDLPDYTLPTENDEITYSDLGELLDSIDEAVSYRAVVYRLDEDISNNIHGTHMGCRRIMNLLRNVENALPREKTADAYPKVTVALRKDITAEIYPDSVTFILPSGEYSFGTFERSELWEPVNDNISRLYNMDKYELSQMTEKEIKERLMGLDLFDVDLALEHDDEFSGRYGYFYCCGQWIVCAASDDLVTHTITGVTVQKTVEEASAAE